MSRALYFILFGCLIILGYIRYLENKGIFFPQKGIDFYPSSVNLPFEDVYLKTEDKAKINGWFIPCDKAEYTLLFLHGNAGNIGHRLEKLLILRNARINIFIFDYRGYGRSQGNICEKGFYRDAKAAYEYLVNERGIRPEQIILYGESIGTAAVIDLAAKAKVRALILEGAFSRGKDVAKKFYPFLPAFIFSDTFNSLKKIKDIRVPKLFIHSRDDEILPFELADKLYKASPEPKDMAVIEGSHNTAFLDAKERYIASIRSFIEKLNRRQI